MPHADCISSTVRTVNQRSIDRSIEPVKHVCTFGSTTGLAERDGNLVIFSDSEKMIFAQSNPHWMKNIAASPNKSRISGISFISSTWRPRLQLGQKCRSHSHWLNQLSNWFPIHTLSEPAQSGSWLLLLPASLYRDHQSSKNYPDRDQSHASQSAAYLV